MKKLALAFAMVVGLSACGGGGGGADAPSYLAGTYNGSYGTTQDNCLVTGGVSGLTNQQVVTVDGSTVRVQINAYSLIGGARDDGGLSAVYEEKSNGITTKLTVTYAMPAGQAAPGNGTFDSELLIQTYADPNSFTCNVRLNGQVVKVG